jgi:hypothetical protein
MCKHDTRALHMAYRPSRARGKYSPSANSREVGINDVIGVKNSVSPNAVRQERRNIDRSRRVEQSRTRSSVRGWRRPATTRIGTALLGSSNNRTHQQQQDHALPATSVCRAHGDSIQRLEQQLEQVPAPLALLSTCNGHEMEQLRRSYHDINKTTSPAGVARLGPRQGPSHQSGSRQYRSDSGQRRAACKSPTSKLGRQQRRRRVRPRGGGGVGDGARHARL